MNIDLAELGLAYRRVKADLYYTKYANSIKLLRFEKELQKNIVSLRKMLAEERFEELCSSYCYGWRLVPKSVEMCDDGDAVSKTTILVGDDLRRVSRCDLRIIEDLPIEFHIVTQLWIDRLGGRLEAPMSSRSFGNRIRCHGTDVNVYYPGTFKYWMKQYRDWHDNGLRDIRSALDKGKDVAVLTTDFTSFYHKLSPDFIECDDYLRQFGVILLPEEDRKLTSLVVKMLKTWSASTPVETGLPVGCSVSSVLANMALTLLDREIEKLDGLVYYGRYVDDIILAIENTKGIVDQESFIEWLRSQIPELELKKESVAYKPHWLKLEDGCSLFFQKKKTKVFLFKGPDGKDFIESLENQIHKRTSEWRALPELPDDPVELVKSIIAITDNHGVEVDKLRQAEEASIRRAAFAMKLSDFGDYSLCLDASDWSKQRKAFIKAVTIYFTTAKNYFELSRYFPRLLSLALHGMAASDGDSFKIVEEMLGRVAKTIDKSFEGDVYVSSREAKSMNMGGDCRDILTYQAAREFCEAVAAATRNQGVRDKAFNLIRKVFPAASGIVEEVPSYDELLLSDLAQQPYKTVLFSALDVVSTECDYKSHTLEGLREVVPDDLFNNAVEFLKMRGEWADKILAKSALSGFVFPTRKLSRVELYAIAPNPYSKKSGSRKVISEYLRLISYGAAEYEDLVPLKHGRPALISVQDRRGGSEATQQGKESSSTSEIRIALAYWRMSDDDWRYQVNGRRNPNNPQRFARLMKLTNSMLKTTSGKKGVGFEYVMYPELAMPWRWFLLVEKKLHRYGVSLISGVEYIRSMRKRMLRNEVWCGLSYSGNGFPDSLLIKVQKTCPAEEEDLLLKENDWVFEKLPSPGGFQAGDVIRHERDSGTLFFSVLICSDLTDIHLRERLRGRIDLLCVPAWNQDVKTFNALVTATAYDLHSYVALCNNGQFGDTRIRGPFARDYERDVVQLKGGNNDYWVVGSVNVEALRRSHKKCPASFDPKFKPMPIGFKMSKEREECVTRIATDDAVHSLRFVRVDGSVVTVSTRGKQMVSKFDLSALSSEAKVLKAVGDLVSNGVSSDIIKEFLLACKVCSGVDVGV